MKPILEIKNISKKYKISSKRMPYLSMRDQLFNIFSKTPSTESFWALKDISLDVFEGECIGIIGRNGAGKSTLLKVLSRITPPTKGYIKARGKVASLLEVGTGFHYELTGRENIYLNGSILGLRKQAITQKFDEIVDFSGVEAFLDTPLKHYSSGMQLRLAFAVAAHLEPEILLIDEVLAVGDTAFQKKCIGKMNEVNKSGRTILFVSHQLDIVRKICSRGIVLSQGEIVASETIDQAVDYYLRSNSNKTGIVNWSFDDALGKEELKILSIRLSSKANEYKAFFDYEENIQVEIHYFISEPLKHMRINIQILTHNEMVVFATTSQSYETFLKEAGYYVSKLTLPSHFFSAQDYKISIHSDCVNYKELLPNTICMEFEVIHSTPNHIAKTFSGVTAPTIEWEVQALKKS